MRYLFDEWEGLSQKLNKAPIFLFLDYDGTLVPIASIPGHAIMPNAVRELLVSLTKLFYCKVAIVSGRALDDIKNMVGLRNVIYVGNHGLELQGPKIKFESPVPDRLRLRVRRICKKLEQKLSKIHGLLIEDKGLTLSLHYRLVDEKQISYVKTVFHETVIIDRIRGDIEIKSGKKVLEVRPAVDWDKGKAVLWLLARQHFFLKDKKVMPIYIGDDVTDEDAFKVLKKKGLTIFVGESKISQAQYYLKNTEEVLRFLKRILELKKRENYA